SCRPSFPPCARFGSPDARCGPPAGAAEERWAAPPAAAVRYARAEAPWAATAAAAVHTAPAEEAYWGGLAAADARCAPAGAPGAPGAGGGPTRPGGAGVSRAGETPHPAPRGGRPP